MIITKDNLIKKIAEQTELDAAVIRYIFQTMEEIIFTTLSATTPEEKTVIRVLDGLSLEGSYIPEKTIHTFDTLVCSPRIRVKPKITRYYNRKLNG